MNEAIYSKWFDASFKDKIVESEQKPTANIDDIFKSGGDFYVISGDFYGIQKFIFEGLATKNAAKVLRAKSAFVQIFTQAIAKWVCARFEIDEKHILSATAGKFEILSPKFDKDILDNINDKIADYFVSNFYGLSGMNIVAVECEASDFKDKDAYKALRKKIMDKVEEAKYQKFNLLSRDSILKYDKGINNQNLCKICNMRKAIEDDKCGVCDAFIKLGEKLAVKNDKNDKIEMQKDLHIDFLAGIEIALTEKIKSYVRLENNEIASFETLAQIDSKAGAGKGAEAIGVIKADVDGMGNFIKNSEVTDKFENFDTFSKALDGFFSLYVPNKLMKNEYRHTYTVFAGGDDLFIVGAWHEILKLARDIRSEFERFIKKDDKEKLSISFGVILAKPSVPISYLANTAEEALEKAKHIDDGKKVEKEKDAITLFGETAKWDDYIDTHKVLYDELKNVSEDVMTTAFLYRLLELCDMSKEVKSGKPEKAIWKSKLNYSFVRNKNMLKSYEGLLKTLDEQIENHPKEAKMVICEYIYTRRSK